MSRKSKRERLPLQQSTALTKIVDAQFKAALNEAKQARRQARIENRTGWGRDIRAIRAAKKSPKDRRKGHPAKEHWLLPPSKKPKRKSQKHQPPVPPRFSYGVMELDPQRYAPAGMRATVIERDSYHCRYCGAAVTYATANIDHVVPWRDGGPTEVCNLVTACPGCNKAKGNSRHPYWAQQLKKQRAGALKIRDGEVVIA